ncbi:kinase-like protein, partial [Marasmius fiardii PR-910]
SRWMAPELFDYSVADGERQYRPPRDIYAFGCTILEIMTGRPPFDHIQHDAAVIFQVVNDKVRPLRPTDGWCPDDVWDLVTLCWQQDPSQRPGATSINGYLTGLRNGTETRPALALKHLVHGESKRRLSRIPGVGF